MSVLGRPIRPPLANSGLLARAAEPRPLVSHWVWGALVCSAIFLAFTVLLELRFAALILAAGCLYVALVAHQRERVVTAELRRKVRDQESYRRFIDTAIEGFFRTTREGRYVEANGALARIYGYASAAQLVAEMGDIAGSLYVDPARRGDFLRILDRDGQVHDFMSEIRRRDGSTIWIAENARAMCDEDGTFLYFEGTVEDITVQRRSEDAMRHALTEAEEGARAKAAFLAAMSHDLKTPLNAIIGFSDLMRQELFGPIGEPRYQTYVGHIHDNGKILLNLLGDVLDLTRAEAGLLVLDEENIVLDDALDSVLAQLVPEGRPAAAIVREVPADFPLLRVDPRRFRQILMHVISNAIQFTKLPGTIVIRATVPAEGGCSLRVTDSGTGMPPERIAQALRPFQHFDGGLSRRFEEVSVGLPLANELLRLHGAGMAIESKPNAGTAVILTLPPYRVLSHLAATA